MSKNEEIKGLIDDLRSTPGANLSRQGCLILANLIEELQEELSNVKGVAKHWESQASYWENQYFNKEY